MRKLWQISKVKMIEESIKLMKSRMQKGGYPKRVHMRTRKREFEKSVIRYARTKMNGSKQMLWSIFCALVGQVHHHQGKCRCFLPP